MKAALYALHYIHSTHDFGISFTSQERQPAHTYVHYPDASDAEAYKDASPPPPGRSHLLTTYSDTCWGSQIGNSVPDGTQLPLFKFHSMSSAIVYRMGGPIAWKGLRQEKTSHSSCEAEIRATNTGSKLTMEICNLIEGPPPVAQRFDPTSNFRRAGVQGPVPSGFCSPFPVRLFARCSMVCPLSRVVQRPRTERAVGRSSTCFSTV